MPLNTIDHDEYLQQCDFLALRTPNIHHLIANELRNTGDYIGYIDTWEKYGVASRILSVALWDDFTRQLVQVIKLSLSPSICGKSITQQSVMIKNM